MNDKLQNDLEQKIIDKAAELLAEKLYKGYRDVGVYPWEHHYPYGQNITGQRINPCENCPNNKPGAICNCALPDMFNVRYYTTTVPNYKIEFYGNIR